MSWSAYLAACKTLAKSTLEADSGAAAWERVQAKVKATGQEWIQDKLNEVVLAYVWPRIDENVSLHRNHLLKGCFVAHPKTGRVAEPVWQEELFKFCPASVPSIRNWRGGVPQAAEPQALPCFVEKPKGDGKAKKKKANPTEGKKHKYPRLGRGASKKPSPLVPQQGEAMDIEELGSALVVVRELEPFRLAQVVVRVVRAWQCVAA